METNCPTNNTGYTLDEIKQSYLKSTGEPKCFVVEHTNACLDTAYKNALLVIFGSTHAPVIMILPNGINISPDAPVHKEHNRPVLPHGNWLNLTWLPSNSSFKFELWTSNKHGN